jgi:LacI family transcriptional regulator
MPVTLKDIAKHTGLSVSSVSNILSGNDPRYNDATRERVMEAARKLDYHPHRAARIMQGRGSGVFGVMVPDLSFSYFPEIIRGIERVADDAGYQLLLCQTHYDSNDMMRKLSLLREHCVDGLILFPIPFSQENTVVKKRMKYLPFPVVCVDSKMEGFMCDYVGTDDYKGAYTATTHLCQQGRTRIACITFGDDSLIKHERLKGYRDALRDNKLPVDDSLCVPGPWDIDMPADELLSLFQGTDKPDGIFGMSDLLAIWASMRLKEKGYSIPADIAVIGFGGLFEGKWFDPPLTTMTQKMDKMGGKAVSLLLERIKQPKSPLKQILLEPELTIRASSGAE